MPVESNLLVGYQAACSLAVERFADADPEQLAHRCSGGYDAASRSVSLVYLGSEYAAKWPSGEIVKAGSDVDVPVTTRVLLLNYILSAHRQPSTGESIAFRDIPGAATYEPSFVKRSVNPLVRAFDGKPDLLYAAATKLGGERTPIADAGVAIPVLPLLNVTYGVWHGDEEFPASGVILFDSSARRLLPVECLVVAAGNGVYEMIKIAKSSSASK